MALGTLNLILKLNYALAVRRILIVVLTTKNFAADKVPLILNEIEDKIYENFPKVKKDDEDEKLSGAKIYISNICFKYNARESLAGMNQQMNLHDYRESLKNTKAINLDLSNPTTEVKQSITA